MFSLSFHTILQGNRLFFLDILRINQYRHPRRGRVTPTREKLSNEKRVATKYLRGSGF